MQQQRQERRLSRLSHQLKPGPVSEKTPVFPFSKARFKVPLPNYPAALDWERAPPKCARACNLKFTGLTHNFPVDPAVF
jgi:hypothetical protein